MRLKKCLEIKNYPRLFTTFPQKCLKADDFYIDRLFGHSFKNNDSALFGYHTDKENLLQMTYMITRIY